MRKFLLRKRVISVILTAITSVLLAVYPKQALELLKLICNHLPACIELEEQAEQTEVK